MHPQHQDAVDAAVRRQCGARRCGEGEDTGYKSTSLPPPPRRRLIPLSQVDQYLGPAGRIRNGTGFDFFARS
jgi:hypothetical protein